MDAKKTVAMNSFINISSCAAIVAVVVFVVYGYSTGLFSSVDAFRKFIQGFGIWSALVFILVQAVSVLIPIMPTSIGCVAGVLVFGAWIGFWYNYMGICVGSVLAFVFAKRYGKPFVKQVISEKTYDKYIGWANREKNFEKLFALGIVLPILPDDAFCYIAGLTEMKYKNFVLIILLGKIASISLYSFGLMTVIYLLFPFLK